MGLSPFFFLPAKKLVNTTQKKEIDVGFARRPSADKRARALVSRRACHPKRPVSRFRDSSRVTPSRTRLAAASARVERVWSCCSPEDTSRSSPLSRHEVQGGADAPQGLRAPHQGVQRGTRRPPGARRSPRPLRSRPNRAKRSRRIRAARADWTFPARFLTTPKLLRRASTFRRVAKEKASDAPRIPIFP